MALKKKDIQLIKGMFDEQADRIKAIDHKIDAVDKRLQQKIDTTENSVQKKIETSTRELKTDLTSRIKSLEIYMRTEFRAVYARFDRTDRAMQSLVENLNATLSNHTIRIIRLEESTGI